MSSRDEILNNIRNSLANARQEMPADTERLNNAKKRIKEHPRGIIPDRRSGSKRSVMALFREKVGASEASFAKVKSYKKAGDNILKYLRDHNLPQQVRMGSDSRLKKLKWDNQHFPQVSYGPSDGDDPVCISHAQSAIAETGTLLLNSGPENPTSLNFLPETHIIVLNKKDLVEQYEECWSKLRRKFGRGNLPRTVNMITGPSRSADIEQTLILGAHGPLRLHVIVVDEA